MKLRFSLFSFFVLLAGLTACGAQQTPSTIRVGVALYQQNDTLLSTTSRSISVSSMAAAASPFKMSRWTAFWIRTTMCSASTWWTGPQPP